MALVLPTLRRSEMFGRLPAAALQRLGSAASVRSVERDHAYYRQDEPATEFFVLASGMVELVRRGPNRRSVAVGFVSPRQSFGAIAPLGRGVHQATAIAIEDGEALVWPAHVVQRLMRRHPRLLERLAQELMSQRDDGWEHTTDLACGPVEWRVVRALVRVARQRLGTARASRPIDLPLRLRDLANFAGTTPYTVSRVLSRLKTSRVISGRRESLRVLQFSKLADSAAAPGLPAARRCPRAAAASAGAHFAPAQRPGGARAV